MTRGTTLLLGLALAVTAAAGAALTVAARPAGRHPGEFHGLVGGLGFGPALELGPCELAFDPRLSPGCSFDWGPIPGGGFFCPHHACSVFPSKPVPPRPRHALP